jgi:AraC-like DNA-binding protein
MGVRAHGHILFWEGASLWVLRAPPGQRYPKTAPHAHHVLQVTLALTGEIGLEVEGQHTAASAIAIAPNVRHTFEGTGLVAHLFIAPDGKPGRQLARELLAGAPQVAIADRLLGDLPERLRATFDDPQHTEAQLCALGRRLTAQLAGAGAPADAPDARIARLLQWLAPRLEGAVSLSDAAQLLKLSPGRLRHLFVEQTGLPFRTYLLWLRLQRAVQSYAGGASLTEAAHCAGFADSAHLSRTFRRMFGIAAVSLRLT